MALGKKWTHEHDRILLMYIHLTIYKYAEIAEQFQILFEPWCKLATQDIRSRNRKTPLKTPSGTDRFTLANVPLADEIENRRVLHGQDAFDVANFVRDKHYDELNDIGQHYQVYFHDNVPPVPAPTPTPNTDRNARINALFEDDSEDELSGYQTMGTGTGNEGLPTDDRVGPQPRGFVPPNPMGLGPSRRGMTPLPIDPLLFGTAGSAGQPDDSMDDFSWLDEDAGNVLAPPGAPLPFQPVEQPQLPPNPQYVQALVATPRQVHDLINGQLNPDNFQFLTWSNSLTFDPQGGGPMQWIDPATPNPATGAMDPVAYTFAAGMIAVTRDQVDRLYRRLINQAQFFAEAAANPMIYVPVNGANGQPQHGPDGRLQYRLMIMVAGTATPQAPALGPRRGKKMPPAETPTKASVRAKVGSKPAAAKAAARSDKVKKPEVAERRRSTRYKKA